MQFRCKYISRMDVLETAKNLINEILDVINRNGLFRVDDTMQICLHQILNNVDVFKFFNRRRRWDYVDNSNDILMIKHAHKLDLSKNPFGIHWIVKCSSDFLYSYFFIGIFIKC